MTTEGPIQVAASADDAHENDAGAGFSSTNLSVYVNVGTNSGFRYNGGYRFNAFDVAGTVTIDDVDLEVYFTFSGDAMDADIRANLVADAVDFSTDPDVTTRVDSASTTKTASWTHGPTTIGFRKSSTDDAVDARAVVQEVIEGGSWATGNDIVMLIQPRGDAGFSFCWTRSYDGNASQAAKLTVDYTAGGGGPAVLASRRLLSGTGR